MKLTGLGSLIAALWFLAGGVSAQPGGLPAEVVINGVEFVHVPGGTFWYPAPQRDEKNRWEFAGTREVRASIDGFYIGKYEARGSDFARFLNSGQARKRKQYEAMPSGEAIGSGAVDGCAVRRGGDGAYHLVAPGVDLPATHLSWELAVEFAGWLGFRLPTDAEWVRAFRGDDKRVYPWGDEYPDDTFAGFQEGATNCNARPVDAFPKGRSPYGAYNMAGNVFEYVADWYNPKYLNALRDGVRNPFAAEPFQPPTDGQRPQRRLRGGRWASHPSQLAIRGNIDLQEPDEAFNCFGVRFAIDEAEVRRHLAVGSAQARTR